MISTYISLLGEFGLDNQESRTYLTLLEIGAANISDIALHSGIKRTSIYNFIGHLVEIGVVNQSVQGKKRIYKAVDPESLVTLQEKKLETFKKRAKELALFVNPNVEKPRITHYVGTDQIKQIFNEIVNCKHECMFIWPHTLIPTTVKWGDDYLGDLEEMRIKSGVTHRLLRIPSLDLDNFITPSLADEHLREIRYALKGTDFPMAMCIYDTGKVAFVSSHRESFGFMIESKELYQSMTFLFNLFWNSLEKPENIIRESSK